MADHEEIAGRAAFSPQKLENDFRLLWPRQVPFFVKFNFEIRERHEWFLRSDGLDRAHEVHETGSLECAVALEVGGAVHENPLDLLRLADVFAPDGKKRR